MSCQGRDLKSFINNIERDFIMIEEWFNNNRTLINVTKTHVIHFSTSVRYRDIALNRYKKISFVKNFEIFSS